MNVTVNGEAREVDDRATVVDVAGLLGKKRPRLGVAVAVNGAVVPKSEWETTTLVEGDRIEVLNAIGGG